MHRPVRQGVARALEDIFSGGYPADKVIERHFKINKKWGSQDRKLFAECVYDVVRWWRRLNWALGAPWPVEKPDFEKLSALWCRVRGVETDLNVDSASVARWEAKDSPRAVRESLPDELDDWGARELGARWDELLPVLNTVAPVYLRANRLKAKAAEVKARLAEENIEALECGGDALRLSKRANIFATKAFRSGYFEVQDLNSQKVAEAVNPRPGERVVDACAGAGGKALHLASLMGNKGKIVALDVHERKLEALRERSTRAGATSIETRWIASSKVIKRLYDSADRLLLDVPCSGSGVLRRNPDSKWRLTASELERLKSLQKEILYAYAPICRPGGRLVYSTCSIFPSENENQVDAFINEAGTGWKVISRETLWPTDGGGDGFFIAVLERVPD